MPKEEPKNVVSQQKTETTVWEDACIFSMSTFKDDFCGFLGFEPPASKESNQMTKEEKSVQEDVGQEQDGKKEKEAKAPEQEKKEKPIKEVTKDEEGDDWLENFTSF